MDPKKRKAAIKYIIYTIHFNIFLYSTAYWIQTGVLPFLSKKLQVNLVTFGYLQTTFSVIQLIGGPIYGRYGDLVGTRAALMIAFIGAAFTYGLLGLAYSIPLLFLSRLPSIFLHAMHGAQMVISDCSSGDERAGALGKLGLSYGLGMILGPMVGGVITRRFNEQSAAFVACFLSVVSVASIFLVIPEKTKTLATSAPETSVESESKDSLLNISKLIELLKLPGIGFLMIIKLAFGFPLGIFNSLFSLVAIDEFGLNPEQNGLILSFTGLLGMLVQGFLIEMLTKRYDDKKILFGCVVVQSIVYLSMSYFVSSIIGLCLVIVPQVIVSSIANVIFSSTLTKSVPAADNGAMLGLSYSTDAFVNAIAPLIGSYLLSSFGWFSIGLFGFGIYSITIISWTLFSQP
ncbi:uncharacterized protein TRIADDRAFT_58186 [Trichoplax adhaerens]|uniref:Major facilitator superfamily (MFS) profile domain-containing protein n=1 Tax=Trichoplax adhaerens TaxID=10228 RepID=B3S139_TRIAD|nr:hypothetical protein TRIADDRAFT_58186 [Trichoplax adhaerens]EDV23499.1 hypothetical protein TRIADDRAFT_58186 [Trichoplax adhaerens]|eukprot:XP_002114409.1 hypothetical protein TRIADDRAFT_58186 [Trichoplax adhaerens]